MQFVPSRRTCLRQDRDARRNPREAGLESLHVKSCRNLRQERARGRRRKARAWYAGSLLYRVWRKNRARSLAKNANAVRCAGQKLLHTHPQLSSMKSFRLSIARGWPITTPGASTGQWVILVTCRSVSGPTRKPSCA